MKYLYFWTPFAITEFEDGNEFLTFSFDKAEKLEKDPTKAEMLARSHPGAPKALSVSIEGEDTLYVDLFCNNKIFIALREEAIEGNGNAAIKAVKENMEAESIRLLCNWDKYKAITCKENTRGWLPYALEKRKMSSGKNVFVAEYALTLYSDDEAAAAQYFSNIDATPAIILDGRIFIKNMHRNE